MEGLARHEVASIICIYPLSSGRCKWRKLAHHGPPLISSHRPRQPRPQELRSDAAPARTGCANLNLTQRPLGTDQPSLRMYPTRAKANEPPAVPRQPTPPLTQSRTPTLPNHSQDGLLERPHTGAVLRRLLPRPSMFDTHFPFPTSAAKAFIIIMV